jgi:hypothetical protein
VGGKSLSENLFATFDAMSVIFRMLYLEWFDV